MAKYIRKREMTSHIGNGKSRQGRRLKKKKGDSCLWRTRPSFPANNGGWAQGPTFLSVTRGHSNFNMGKKETRSLKKVAGHRR